MNIKGAIEIVGWFFFAGLCLAALFIPIAAVAIFFQTMWPQ